MSETCQELQNIKIMLPPVEVQNKYEQIVKAVRSRLDKHEQSKVSLNSLFSSLSQKAFAGQL